MNGRNNIVIPASYHDKQDCVSPNIVILSPNAVAFHPKSLHESKSSIMIRQRSQNYHYVDDNGDEHHEIIIKRRPSFLSNFSPFTPYPRQQQQTNVLYRRRIYRRDSYCIANGYPAAANGPDRVMDSISMEDKSGADTLSAPRGSTSKSSHHHQSFSGWDRSSKRYGNKDRKIGHRRVDEAGQVTYKKIETSQICGSIQLGIQTAISSLASQPDRDLLMLDFTMIETTNFVKEGTNCTPAHHYSDFKFKNYAPIAFRYFRDLFGIAPEDFLQSFGTEPLRELTNPGASGSVFYLTYDDEFIIKTVQHKEAEFLQKLLPGYYMVSLLFH